MKGYLRYLSKECFAILQNFNQLFNIKTETGQIALIVEREKLTPENYPLQIVPRNTATRKISLGKSPPRKTAPQKTTHRSSASSGRLQGKYSVEKTKYGKLSTKKLNSSETLSQKNIATTLSQENCFQNNSPTGYFLLKN